MLQFTVDTCRCTISLVPRLVRGREKSLGMRLVHDTKCFNFTPNSHSLHAVETSIRSTLIPRVLIRVWVYISGQLETLLHTLREKPIAAPFIMCY